MLPPYLVSRCEPMDFLRSSLRTGSLGSNRTAVRSTQPFFIFIFLVFGFGDSGLMSRFGEPIYLAFNAADYFPPSPSSCLQLSSPINDYYFRSLGSDCTYSTVIPSLPSTLHPHVSVSSFPSVGVGNCGKSDILLLYLFASFSDSALYPFPTTFLLSHSSSSPLHHTTDLLAGDSSFVSAPPTIRSIKSRCIASLTPKLPSPESRLHRRNTPRSSRCALSSISTSRVICVSSTVE